MKVSAIVSAYKCAPYLESRIANLLEQTLIPEIVLVCQNGSDEAKVIEDTIFRDTEKWDHILAIYTDDLPTVYEAWNLGIKECHGDYILIANSDDRLTKHAVEKMARILDETDYGLVYPDCNVVNELNGEYVSSFEWAEGNLLQGCFIGPSPMYKKSLHTLGYFPNMQVAGDYAMWLQFQHSGVEFYHLKEKLCTFWDHGDNIEYRLRNRNIIETARIKNGILSNNP